MPGWHQSARSIRLQQNFADQAPHLRQGDDEARVDGVLRAILKLRGVHPQRAPQHVDLAVAPLLQLVVGADLGPRRLELLLQQQRGVLLRLELAAQLGGRAGLREPRLELSDHLSFLGEGALQQASEWLGWVRTVLHLWTHENECSGLTLRAHLCSVAVHRDAIQAPVGGRQLAVTLSKALACSLERRTERAGLVRGLVVLPAQAIELMLQVRGVLRISAGLPRKGRRAVSVHLQAKHPACLAPRLPSSAEKLLGHT